MDILSAAKLLPILSTPDSPHSGKNSWSQTPSRELRILCVSHFVITLDNDIWGLYIKDMFIFHSFNSVFLSFPFAEPWAEVVSHGSSQGARYPHPEARRGKQLGLRMICWASKEWKVSSHKLPRPTVLKKREQMSPWAVDLRVRWQQWVLWAGTASDWWDPEGRKPLLTAAARR